MCVCNLPKDEPYSILFNKTACATRELFAVRCSALDRRAQRLRLIRASRRSFSSSTNWRCFLSLPKVGRPAHPDPGAGAQLVGRASEHHRQDREADIPRGRGLWRGRAEPRPEPDRAGDHRWRSAAAQAAPASDRREPRGWLQESPPCWRS